MSFFNELKRRNVIRVGLAYVVVAWLMTQVLQILFESFGTPDWVMKTVLVLLAAGLPFALIFAWAFEITPEGLKREKEIDRSRSITLATGRKLDRAIIGVLVVALGYFVFDKFVADTPRNADLIEAAKQEVVEPGGSQANTEPAPSDKSIAVLPFINMSGDQENEYFSDGLTEELLNALARIKELKVTGRTSSFAFKGQNTDLREVGEALNVAHILEGSVRKAQNRVRITAQLIKVEDGYHLWSDTFDRELDDIFAIQEEIATRVVSELTSTLLGSESGPFVSLGTKNTQAYEAYLRGRYLFTRNPDDPQVQNEAEQLYRRAIELDPDFVLAWYGQFFVISYRKRSGGIEYREGAAQMQQLADKMIAMNPEIAEVHIAYGRAKLVSMHWSEAEAAIRKAVRLNPGNVDALFALTGMLAVLDKPEKALEYALEALSRDPLDLQALGAVSTAYSLLGQCEKVEEITKRALSLSCEAGRFNGRVGLCWGLYQEDHLRSAEWYEKEPLSFMKDTGLAIAYNKLGQQEKAQHYLETLVESKGDAASYQYAQIYAQWGETEKALDALEHAKEIGDTGLILMYRDKNLEPLRQEPRFIALLEFWKGSADL